jgi:hypothetical protein
VKPQPGSIYKLRTNACSKSKRISFAEYVSNVNQQTSDEVCVVLEYMHRGREVKL